MKELEVFFDFECPFCLRGYNYLQELLPKFPDIKVVWRPCEAHPEPEEHYPHSHLILQGLFFALDNNVDINEYSNRMYQAVAIERQSVEDIKVVLNIVKGILDTDALETALRNGTYAKKQSDGNDYAYEESGVWAVPSYRMNGKKLDAVEGVGVTKAQLEDFLLNA
jgi:predicted DsbA family dithiol-disulfide isomerase